MSITSFPLSAVINGADDDVGIASSEVLMLAPLSRLEVVAGVGYATDTGGAELVWGLVMGPHMDLIFLNSWSHSCKDFFKAERGW